MLVFVLARNNTELVPLSVQGSGGRAGPAGGGAVSRQSRCCK